MFIVVLVVFVLSSAFRYTFIQTIPIFEDFVLVFSFLLL